MVCSLEVLTANHRELTDGKIKKLIRKQHRLGRKH